MKRPSRSRAIGFALLLGLVAPAPGCGASGVGEGSSGAGGGGHDAGGAGGGDISNPARDTGTVGPDDAGGTDGAVSGDASHGGNVAGGDGSGGDATTDGEGTDCPGGAGCDCIKNNECDNGICLDTADGKKCARTCTDECPQGYTCKQLGTSDLIFVCAPDFVPLCSPCNKNADCRIQGSEALCLDYGPAGSFCGGLCAQDSDCPSGYECVDAYDQEKSKLSKQCKLAAKVEAGSGKDCTRDGQCGAGEGCVANKCTKVVQPVCGCSVWAKAAAIQTACSVTNDFGSCPGERSCGAAGLSECTGGTPAKEVCDGKDSDCDGQTDEGSCDDGDLCTTDTCSSSTGKCASEPAVDCDDQNPCTADSCDAKTGKCASSPAEGSCDDDDACTIGDLCGVDGDGKAICKPGGDKKACDDGNLCTDDGCDAQKGCVYLPNAASETCYTGLAGTGGKGTCAEGRRLCSGGKLGQTCQGEVLPAGKEACDGKDDTCDGTTDEGCKPIDVQGGFSTGGGRTGATKTSIVASFGGQAAGGTVSHGKGTLQGGFIPWLLSFF